MKINRKLVPDGLGNNPNRVMERVKFVTVHTTGNTSPTADAKSHADYLAGGSGGRQASWHYTVDGGGVWQSFEDNRICWHAGDGNGDGNNASIGIEICVNDRDKFGKACENAARLTAELLKRHNLAIEKVRQHFDWSKKDCPKELRSGSWGVTWERFLRNVNEELGMRGEDLTPIEGKSAATAGQMSEYIKLRNPKAPDYAAVYLREGEAEGIRGDLAFAQSCLETGHWRFGGCVSPEQNNFGGLGATGNGVKGLSFPDAQIGIRAQIQHLKAYANAEPLKNACVNPRFGLVKRGSAPYLEWLSIPNNPERRGWAADPDYAAKINKILGEITASVMPQNEITAKNLVKDGVSNDFEYWLGVLDGRIELNRGFLKVLLDRYNAKVKAG
jgi:hypothetical protein